MTDAILFARAENHAGYLLGVHERGEGVRHPPAGAPQWCFPQLLPGPAVISRHLLTSLSALPHLLASASKVGRTRPALAASVAEAPAREQGKALIRGIFPACFVYMTYCDPERCSHAAAGRCQHRRLPEGCGGYAGPGRVLDRPHHPSNARSSCSPLCAATAHVGGCCGVESSLAGRDNPNFSLFIGNAVAIGHIKPLRCAVLQFAHCLPYLVFGCALASRSGSTLSGLLSSCERERCKWLHTKEALVQARMCLFLERYKASSHLLPSRMSEVHFSG